MMCRGLHAMLLVYLSSSFEASETTCSFKARYSSLIQKRTSSQIRKSINVGGEVPSYTLRDGYEMPVLGLGTFGVGYDTVRTALDLGYRMFDTAALYGNEEEVGRAIRDSGVSRSDVFVTTKVWDTEHGYEPALNSGKQSNLTLGLGYIDLLLIHGPHNGKIVETYDALLQLQESGIVRSVGVSNFGVEHLMALEEYCRPVPALNQFELHPLIFSERKRLVEYCQDKQIVVQAYASVMKGNTDFIALAEETGKAHNKTAAQALLRWALDQEFMVIPSSKHEEHLAENIDVFDFQLSPDEINHLSDLSKTQPQEMYPTRDPATVPVDVGDVQPSSSCTSAVNHHHDHHHHHHHHHHQHKARVRL